MRLRLVEMSFALVALEWLPRVASREFDMEGRCAAILQEQKWQATDKNYNWDYKIMVDPWTTFGEVTVNLHGLGMQVQHVYGAEFADTRQTLGDRFTVSLNAIGGSGCENCESGVCGGARGLRTYLFG